MNAKNLNHPSGEALIQVYRDSLLQDVIPFWLKYGLDREQGGFLTALDRDGTVVDDDKSIWFQGRSAWMFATLVNTVERKPEWLEAAQSSVEFLRQYGSSPDGKLYFTTTRDGRPLRMRRYVYSEAFAAIANAALTRATGDSRAAEDAVVYFESYLSHSFELGGMPPKVDPLTRPTLGIGPLMIAIATAQELRENLGDAVVKGRTYTGWIDWAIDQIERHFLKPEYEALMEVVGPHGEVLDHFDGRQLNPGHAIECAWFILHEGKLRDDARLDAPRVDDSRLDVAARLG